MRAQGSFKAFLLATGTFAWTATGYSQPSAIATGQSQITVHVYKAGVFSALGHDHVISAPISSGSVDKNQRRVDLRMNAGALRVMDPGASEKDREEIQRTMLGPEVLDTEHYPEITFRSTGAEQTQPGSWSVRGNLTLHGQTLPATVEVRETGGHYVGTSELKQTDFGIKPVKVAGGTIRVKDEIRIGFDIQLAR